MKAIAKHSEESIWFFLGLGSVFFSSQNCYLLSELQSNQDTNKDVDLCSSHFKHVLDQRAEDLLEI